MKTKLSTAWHVLLVSGLLFCHGVARGETVLTNGLLLWNRLGSTQEVQNSEVGVDGVIDGGRFVQGMFGNGFDLHGCIEW